MRNALIVARRELGGYFATPVAAVFIVIFLALQGALTFNLGNFFERNQADLAPFFNLCVHRVLCSQHEHRPLEVARAKVVQHLHSRFAR